MQCDTLKRMITRACEFSGKNDFGQNCVFRVKNGTLEIRASDGMTGISISEHVGVDMKDMECAVNIYALESSIKIFDSDSDIIVNMTKSKLTFDNDEDKVALPIMDVDTVFYVPKPLNWIIAPHDFATKLAMIRGMHFTTLKGMDKDIEDLVIIKKDDICQFSRSVYVFEKTDTNITVSVEAKMLQKISKTIDEYCLENNRLYLKSGNEWCMLAASSRPIPKYEILFTEVQKTNNSVIRINSNSFLTFCDKLLKLKKAEEYSTIQPNHSIKLEFLKGQIKGITETGSTLLKLEDNSNECFTCAIVTDFFKAASYSSFLLEDETQLHIGKDMRLIKAVNGTAIIMGVLCRV